MLCCTFSYCNLCNRCNQLHGHYLLRVVPYIRHHMDESGDEQLLLTSAPLPPPGPSNPQPISEHPPVYSPPSPAAGPSATSAPLVAPQPPPLVIPAQIPVTTETKPFVLGAPPEYTYHVPPTHHAAAVMPAANAGLPVQVQVDGRLLSATLVQDVSVCVCSYVCSCVCVRVCHCVCVCVCMHSYTYVCVHTCIRTCWKLLSNQVH